MILMDLSDLLSHLNARDIWHIDIQKNQIEALRDGFLWTFMTMRRKRSENVVGGSHGLWTQLTQGSISRAHHGNVGCNEVGEMSSESALKDIQVDGIIVDDERPKAAGQGGVVEFSMKTGTSTLLVFLIHGRALD